MSLRELLAKSDDPPRTALAMLEAVEEFVADCLNDDEVDASEGLTPDELRVMQAGLHDVLDVFVTMYRRIGKEL